MRTPALVTLAAVALAGGAAGVGLGLAARGHPVAEPTRPPDAASTSVDGASPPLPTKPPLVAAPSPMPWTAPASIAYMVPGAISFPTAADGWVLGDACDAQQDCETGVARTSDGGATWTMVSSPVGPDPADYHPLDIEAASSDDAWVWGATAGGQGVFDATHDGGASWQPVDLNGAVVVDVNVDGGSAWAVTGCAQGGETPCPVTVLSSPVGGGPWAGLAPLPATVQGAPISNTTLGGPQLVRSGESAWLLNANQSQPGLVTTDDGGQTWVSLPLPCSEYAEMNLAASSPSDLMLACVDMGAWPAPQEVWASQDGGAEWVLRSREWSTLLASPLPDVGTIDNEGAPIGAVLVSSTTAWMVNDREDDLVTHDDGVTWAPGALPAEAGWNEGGGGEGLVFADALDGWTFNSAGLWATTDGGADWNYQPIIGPVPGW